MSRPNASYRSGSPSTSKGRGKLRRATGAAAGAELVHLNRGIRHARLVTDILEHRLSPTSAHQRRATETEEAMLKMMARRQELTSAAAASRAASRRDARR